MINILNLGDFVINVNSSKIIWSVCLFLRIRYYGHLWGGTRRDGLIWLDYYPKIKAMIVVLRRKSEHICQTILELYVI